MLRTLLVTTALTLPLAGCAGSDPEPRDEPAPAASTAVDAGTAPGTELAYGEPATLVWQPSSDVSGELELSVDAVAEQRASVLDGWTRDAALAAARPYFVSVSLTNTGETDLAGQVVPLYLRDDRDRLGAPWTLDGHFEACQSGPMPTPFAPGDSTTMCLVYLAPDGARVVDMVFEPTEGFDPISWTGEVRTPEREGGARSGSGRQRGGGGGRG